MNRKNIGLTFDFFTELNSSKRWSLYTHNRIVPGFKDKAIGFLTFNKLSYTSKPGIGFSINAVATNKLIYPSIGLHYQKSFNRLSLFFLTTYAFDRTTSNENYLIIKYKYPLSKSLSIVSQNDFYTLIHKWSHDLSLERIKLGLEIHQAQIGIYNESTQRAGKLQRTNPTFGMYVRKTFDRASKKRRQ
jgi:hypothetical protein